MIPPTKTRGFCRASSKATTSTRIDDHFLTFSLVGPAIVIGGTVIIITTKQNWQLTFQALE